MQGMRSSKNESIKHISRILMKESLSLERLLSFILMIRMLMNTGSTLSIYNSNTEGDKVILGK